MSADNSKQVEFSKEVWERVARDSDLADKKAVEDKIIVFSEEIP